MVKKNMLAILLLVSPHLYCPPSTDLVLFNPAIHTTPPTTHIQVHQQTNSHAASGWIAAISSVVSFVKEYFTAKPVSANGTLWNREKCLSTTAQAAFAADTNTVKSAMQEQLSNFTKKLNSCQTTQDFAAVLTELQYNIACATQTYEQLAQLNPALNETWQKFNTACQSIIETLRNAGSEMSLPDRIQYLTNELNRVFDGNKQSWQNLATKKDFLKAEQQLTLYKECFNAFEKALTGKTTHSINPTFISEKDFFAKNSTEQQTLYHEALFKHSALDSDIKMLDWHIKGHQQALKELAPRTDLVKWLKGQAGTVKSLVQCTIQRIEKVAHLQKAQEQVTHIQSLFRKQANLRFKESLSSKAVSELRTIGKSLQTDIAANKGTAELTVSDLRERLGAVNEAIQQKTFSPEYRQQLTTLKNSLVAQREYGTSAIQEDRINSIKATLHEQGALHEAHYTLSPQAHTLLEKQGIAPERIEGRFVGNAFEHQTVKENIQILEQVAPYAENKNAQEYVTATVQFVDAALELNAAGNTTEALAASNMAHLAANIVQTIAATGKVLGHVGLGAVEGAIDAAMAPINMALHPIETAKGLGNLAVVATNLAIGDPATTQKLQTLGNEFSQLSLEQKAEQITKFAVSILAPGPLALTKCAGFSKGLTTLGNALQKEVAVLKEGARALAQATRPERAISVAGTKITAKLPESVLREAENLSKNRPGLEFVKKAELAVEKSNTGTVWDKIKITQPFYPNTTIPKSFELHLKNGKFWVAPNATKHMFEYFRDKAQSFSSSVNCQSLLTDFTNSVGMAIEGDIKYNTAITIGKWEFVFSLPRQEGLLPVIHHALYKP